MVRPFDQTACLRLSRCADRAPEASLAIVTLADEATNAHHAAILRRAPARALVVPRCGICGIWTLGCRAVAVLQGPARRFVLQYVSPIHRHAHVQEIVDASYVANPLFPTWMAAFVSPAANGLAAEWLERGVGAQVTQRPHG